ncbi:UNKNOWN [Stylonychia lemnae]|uniref:Uncharacterized protein n=1 Tax=Stylonychia lemnae TaxID=5949 RepID=A0A078APL2_STYLE|nr:UNKNOWN [Stylonychia lemnae]|eukprot:CDW83891.1 UNKNOWN [Stylonychia lemnae]
MESEEYLSINRLENHRKIHMPKKILSFACVFAAIGTAYYSLQIEDEIELNQEKNINLFKQDRIKVEVKDTIYFAMENYTDVFNTGKTKGVSMFTLNQKKQKEYKLRIFKSYESDEVDFEEKLPSEPKNVKYYNDDVRIIVYQNRSLQFNHPLLGKIMSPENIQVVDSAWTADKTLFIIYEGEIEDYSYWQTVHPFWGVSVMYVQTADNLGKRTAIERYEKRILYIINDILEVDFSYTNCAKEMSTADEDILWIINCQRNQVMRAGRSLDKTWISFPALSADKIAAIDKDRVLLLRKQSFRLVTVNTYRLQYY